jgi:hypothetical protein
MSEQAVSEQLPDLQCINASGHSVAWYAIESESNRCFGVEEPYPHLAVGKTCVVL